HRQATETALVARLRELLQQATPGSDAQLQLMTAFAAHAASEQDVAWVRALYTGTEQLEGLSVDTEMRWTLLTSLAAAGAAGEAEIRAEHDRDRTATGAERAARARAARPTAEAKAEAWRIAVEEQDAANQTVEALALGWGRVHDAQALLAPYVQRYHDALTGVWESRTHAIAESIAVGFYPRGLANAALRDASQAWLDVHPDAPAGLRRTVAENRDGITRALACQARDAERPA
ncbi:MAG TPA: ERAP1-like C-terminal domain-containing protein, partial [Nocardioidaceae bacterium]|nr:ERAP1-like C-terminal domain-containing protein [Nocardioidaceae bacterium]